MRRMPVALLALAAWSGAAMIHPAAADTLSLPGAAFERAGSVNATYRADPPASGTGTFELQWTDPAGRLVMQYRQAVTLAPGETVSVPLDLGRAVTLQNQLHATLVLGDRHGLAATSFIARPAPGWDDVQIIQWQGRPTAKLAGMRRLGITGMMALGFRVPFTQADVEARVAPQLQADLRWYVENIATDFYSAYHYWTPEHPQQVNWRFLAAQARHQQDQADSSVNVREPSLSDPAWIARIRQRLADTVRAHMAYRPLWYTLGDEPGIADLAAAWDFDFSPVSLAAFRDWLRLHYGNLAALNAEWGSDFTQWADVIPPTTTTAMRRTDDNFAAWSDFKDFMDDAFASALRAGTQAVHAADPSARAAIEGGQIPGWGGFDYSRLSTAVDAMEIYEAGFNIDIVRALNPQIALISTKFGAGPDDQRATWHALLMGVRGLVLWDDADDIVDAAGNPGPRGQAEAALFGELRGGVGAQLIAATPAYDGVAVLYSPASFRIQWLLDQRARGDAWTRRGSETEGEDNITRAALRQAVGELHALGLQPRFLSSDQVARGSLHADNVRALLLPRAIVLSDEETAEIRAFAAGGGLVLAQGEPGQFDGHGRRLPTPQLAGLPIHSLPATTDLAEILAPVGVTAGFALTNPNGAPANGIETHMLRAGGVTLLSLQRQSNNAGNTDIVVTLPHPVAIRDLRADTTWQITDHLMVRLDPIAPTILALARTALPALTIIAPATARAGETAILHLALSAPSPASTQVLHIEVCDPAGTKNASYSGNAILRGPHLDWKLPLALNDAQGEWTVQAHDILGGGTVTAKITVTNP